MTGGTGNAHKGSSDGGTWWDIKMVGQGERDVGSRELTQYIERADRPDFGRSNNGANNVGACMCDISHIQRESHCADACVTNKEPLSSI